MKNLKIIILLVIITIIILIAVISLLLINKNNTNKEEPLIDTRGDVGEELVVTNEEEIASEPSKVKTVENCLQRFYDNLNNNSDNFFSRGSQGNMVKEISDEEINQTRIELLSKKYIKNNKITSDNVNNFLKTYTEKVIIVPLKMKLIINDPIEKYAVNAILINSDYKVIDKINVYVNLDNRSSTFSIEPIDNEYENFDDVKIENENEPIEKNDNNQFKITAMNFENRAKDLLDKFKKIVLSNAELSYNYIEQEYINKKFKDKSEYFTMIKDNVDRIKISYLTKYLVNNTEKYTEFICVDQNDYYYIFRQEVNNPLNYSVMLDNYTIEFKDFVERYDNGDELKKVGINTGKIISAINCKDFDYVYSKLDTTFKNNNFKTKQDLEQYIKNNLFDINKGTYISFEENGNGIYTYKTNITSLGEESTNSKNLTVIMKLLDNRDFVMSFNIE